jgi:hypothetical protein
MAKAERTIVKKVENAVLYSDGTIRLDNVRLSFPHIGTPQENENDDGKKTFKYGVAGMLPKKTHIAAKDLCKEVIQKLMKDNDAKVATDKWFLANGDDKEQPEYAEHFIVATSESRRPTARKRNGEVMTPQEADDAFYGGCWGNLLIRPWYFNGKAKGSSKSYPKRVCCGIVAVQFLRDDDAFGEGRVTDEGVFDAAADDDWGDKSGGGDADDL